MIWIIVFVVLLGVIGLCRYLKQEEACVVFSMVTGAIIFMVSLILMIEYVNNLKARENLLMLKNTKQIYLKQANELIPQFKEILGNYGKFEERIYDKITINNYNVFVANYPELKNIEAVQSLVQNISDYTQKIYKMDELIEEQKAILRVDSQNPFIIVKEYKEEK